MSPVDIDDLLIKSIDIKGMIEVDINLRLTFNQLSGSVMMDGDGSRVSAPDVADNINIKSSRYSNDFKGLIYSLVFLYLEIEWVGQGAFGEVIPSSCNNKIQVVKANNLIGIFNWCEIYSRWTELCSKEAKFKRKSSTTRQNH